MTECSIHPNIESLSIRQAAPATGVITMHTEDLLAALVTGRVQALAVRTGVPATRLAQAGLRLLDDPQAAVRWPREIRVLRERRERRRQARSAA